MERSVDNRGTTDSTAVSASQAPDIEIKSISINLAIPMETMKKATECKHFSIRGYVAEMREKDITVCSPFSSQSCKLPPLHVPKHKWWGCQNCVKEEAGATSNAPSCSNNKGCEDGSKEHGNKDLPISTCDVTKSGPFPVQEKDTDETVAIESRGKELVEWRAPDSADCEDQQRNELMGGEVSTAVIEVNETRNTSLELEEDGNESLKEDDELLAGNNLQNQQRSSSCLVRRKARKVRLLSDLLSAKENSENENIVARGASPNAMDVIGVDPSPDCQNEVQEDLEMGFRVPRRKRRLTQDKDLKQLAVICPTEVNKKLKGLVPSFETNTTQVADIGLEEDASARVGYKKNLRTKRSSVNRNSIQSQKKLKRIHSGECSSAIVPWQYNQLKIGHVDKSIIAAGTNGFPRTGHEIRPPFQQTEGTSSFLNKKNKMPPKDSLLPLRIITPEEGVKLPSATEKSAVNVNYIDEDGNTSSFSLPQRKNMSAEEPDKGKATVVVGQKTGSPYPISGNKLLNKLNGMNPKTTYLRKTQKKGIPLEDNSFRLPRKLDNAGGSSLKEKPISQEPPEVAKDKNAAEGQKSSDDIPYEIVELMAKNQYEREKPEKKRRSVVKVKSHIRKTHSGHARNGVMGGLDDPNRFGIVPSSQFNVSDVVGSSKSLQSRKKPSSTGTPFSTLGFSRSSNAPAKMPVLEACNTCQNGYRMNDEGSTLQNHRQLGFDIFNKQLGVQPETQLGGLPNILRKGKTIDTASGTINFEKPNQLNFHSQSSMDFLPNGRQRETETNTKRTGGGALEMYTNNETIPAMQLLSLMNAGMHQSTRPFRPNVLDRPLFPCDYHPKTGQEKPFSPPTDFSALLKTGKNGPSAFTSLFQDNGNLKRSSVGGGAFPSQVSSKSQDHERAKGKSPRSNKFDSFKDFGSLMYNRHDPVQQQQQQHLRQMEESAKFTNLEVRGSSVTRTVPPMKTMSETGPCTLNRNPADFSVPDATNIYMIDFSSGENNNNKKKNKKKNSSKDSTNENDGRKRKRDVKEAAPGKKENGPIRICF